MFKYIFVFLVSSGLAAIFLPRHNDGKKDSRQPKAAGVVIAFALIAPLVLSYALDSSAIDVGLLCAITIGAFLILMVGYVNDLYGLRRWHIVIGQLIAILTVLPFGLSIKATSFLPTGSVGSTIGSLITILLFFAVINALSLLSNSPTSVGVIALIICSFFLALSLISSNFIAAYVSIALMGGIAVFLAYRIFFAVSFASGRSSSSDLLLGSCGEMFIGFMIAAISIMLSAFLL